MTDMNKYSVMLVDDEEDVIQAILHKMDWEAMGYMKPEYAHNGLEALDLAESHTPDVVMTDIKMPYMDGLELSRKLKEQYPNIRIIIFSGFDEFEYAKEAIRLEAEEYILKPIDAGELREVFGRIHAALDKELDEKQNVKKLETYYMESLPYLQEDFYASLIEGRISGQRIQKEMHDYQIHLHGPFFCIAILHTSTSDAPEGISPLLMTVSVRKLAEERLSQNWDGRFFSYQGGTVVIAQMPSEDMTRFTDDCDKFCRLARSVCKANVTVGIGQICSQIGDLQMSYEGAKDAVSYRALYGTTKAINIAEIAPQESDNSNDYPDDGLYEVFKNIKIDEKEILQESIAGYVGDRTGMRSSIQGHRLFIMEMVSELYRFARNNHLDSEELFDKNEDIYHVTQQMEPAELTAWLTTVCLKMQEMIRSKRQDNSKSFVGRAIDLVHERYADKNLSIDVVCSSLGVSAAYFSTVFKKETGKTFVNFLTDYRMEKALGLLIEKDEKTYVIAQQVGYEDPNYFSYVFKKQFGMSPSKYKAGKT